MLHILALAQNHLWDWSDWVMGGLLLKWRFVVLSHILQLDIASDDYFS